MASLLELVRTLLAPKPRLKLYCVFCYFVRDEPSLAITIMNGQAICDDHSYYTQGGEFTKTLIMVKNDEKAK